MDAVHLVFNAARQFCLARIEYWQARQVELEQAKADREGNDYTSAAHATFPKYHTQMAILSGIERFTPNDFKSHEEAVALLCEVTQTAQSRFTEPSNAIEAKAICEARAEIRQFISTLTTETAASFPLLPFRRVLSEAEHNQLHAALRAKWGSWYGGDTDLESAPVNVTFHVAAMEHADAYPSLRCLLQEAGVTRLYELREYDDGYELDLELASFQYNGAEGFWTADKMEWLVYASHESSITFGGSWLVTRMRSVLAGYEKFIYKGWDLSLYK